MRSGGGGGGYGGGGGGKSAGTVRNRPRPAGGANGGGAQPEPEPVAPSVSWTEGRVEANVQADDEAETDRNAEVTGRSASSSNTADDDSKDRGASNDPMAALARARAARAAEQPEEIVGSVEDAKEGDKLIVLFIYTSSEDRKFARATEASKKFEEEVLGSFEVATALQDTTNIKLNGEELSRDLRKLYGISTGAPQIILIDPNGKALQRFNANASPETVAKTLEAAKDHVAKLVAKRDASK